MTETSTAGEPVPRTAPDNTTGGQRVAGSAVTSPSTVPDNTKDGQRVIGSAATSPSTVPRSEHPESTATQDMIPQSKPFVNSWKDRLYCKWRAFRRFRRWVKVQCFLFAVVIIVVWAIFTPLAVIFRQKPWNGDYWDGTFPNMTGVQGPYMLAEILDLNVSGRNYVIRWTLDPFAGQETNSSWHSPLFNGDSSTIGADIYRDSDALLGNFDPSRAIFSYNASQYFGLTWDPSFETTIAFSSILSLDSNTWGSEIYPFDSYPAGILFSATYYNSNRSQNIVGLKIIGGFFGYTSTMHITQQVGKTGTPFVAVYLNSYHFVVVKLCTLSLVVIAWLITVAILWMTIREVFGLVQSKRGDTIALPITALFALPTVRTFLPGAPPLGCRIDYLGILPQLLIIGTSASLVLFARTFQGEQSFLGLDSEPITATASHVSKETSA